MTEPWAIDYGEVNINRLIITNDKELYEKQKAQNNVVALLEPSVLKNMNVDSIEPIYLVGWSKKMNKSELKDKVETISEAVKGMTSCQWSRVKQHIDMAYSSQADNVEIDDLGRLKQNLKREFNY